MSKPEQAMPVAASEKEEPSPYDPSEKSEPETLQPNARGLAAVSPQESYPLDDSDRISGLIADQMDTILATVVALEQKKEPVRDAQVEALLLKAQQAMAGQGGSEDPPSLDPSILLAQAEDELDLTFREQILEKLRKEYTRIRSSVADRNK